MSRKQELNERAVRDATQRASAIIANDTRIIVRGHSTSAFLVSYRAAMRDARKAFNSHRRYSLRCIALIEWLRPLR